MSIRLSHLLIYYDKVNGYQLNINIAGVNKDNVYIKGKLKSIFYSNSLTHTLQLLYFAEYINHNNHIASVKQVISHSRIQNHSTEIIELILGKCFS